ncbi:LysR substrate-binding domain-containing protein [Oerskovia flava]|uniref:LysR substrate-binding domain-containing protein n=1 Tax=Oerskovia flava TaxID=2986422 RepID=UPI00223FACCD|nr:LysR substrate-binding domain-containing protein [Oerskovia sp. JB1-3-2]
MEDGQSATDETSAPAFRLAYVPGVTPAKWVNTWRERLRTVPIELVPVEAAAAAGALRDGQADAALLRPPVDRGAGWSDELSLVALYEETPVVVVPTDHLLASLEPEEPVALDDLADEVLLCPLDDVVPWAVVPPGRAALERPVTTGAAVELVAAGIGVLVVPQSLARLHHRKDLTYRVLDGAPSAPVGLAWVSERTTDLVEEMVGIVRGRTANSSRGRTSAPAAEGSAAKERPAAKERAGGKDGARSGGRAGSSRTGGARAGGTRAGGGRAGGAGRAKRGRGGPSSGRKKR